MRQEDSTGYGIGYLVTALICLGLKIPVLDRVTMGWVEQECSSSARKWSSEEEVHELH